MKFNDNQKKWAMTGVLLAALGFNISAPKSLVTYNSTDMAQKSADFKSSTFEYDGDEWIARYSKKGERTDVILDKVEYKTESGTKVLCGGCSTTYTFDTNFQTNTSELNDIAKELLSARVSKTEEEPKRGEKRVKSAKVEKEEKAKAKKTAKAKKSDAKDKYAKLNQALAELSENCSDMESDEDLDLTAKGATMACYSEGLKSLFSDLDSDEINDSTVLSFISRRVMPVQAEVILENRQAHYDYLTGKSSTKPKEIKELLYSLENFIAVIPEGHSKLQQSLINSSASIKTADLKFIQALKQKAANTTVSAEKSAYLDEVLWRTQTNPSLDTELNSMSQRISIVTDGMQKANQFSAGLQQSLAEAFAAAGTTAQGQTGADTVVINGQVYRRTDGMGRGGATGQGIATIPNAVPNNVIQGNFQSSGMPTQFVPAQPGGSTMTQVPGQQPPMYSQPQDQYQQWQQQQQMPYQPQGAAPVSTGRTSGMLRQ
ncbi:hypothetical protein ACLVWU_16195 [Bdellovibrio sp. HCB290]|uniref:hypothetical protein n=1 Tax=Bdellovibrio sp. HCB290 TaxID=3394356 RepID=UPI0039B69C1F